MKKKYVTGLLLAVSAAFIGIGFTDGEAQMVLQKAVMVCLECIGIG